MTISFNDEIQLSKIFNILLDKKFFIAGSTIIFLLIGSIYSYSIQDEYESKSILKVKDDDQKQSGFLDQYVGVATLAGINLPSVGSTNSALTIIEIIKSRDFFKHLLTFEGIKETIAAANSYNAQSDQLSYDKKIYDKNKNKWVRKNKNDIVSIPTHLELYKKYRSMLKVTKSKETGLITISIKHFSPKFANELLALIIEEINQASRNKDTKEVNRSLGYLEMKLEDTNKKDIKDTLNALIEEQLKKQMLINVTQYYVLEPIDNPFIPESKSGPNRIQIAFIFAILGLTLSIIWSLISSLYKDN